ncbi:MAG: hypothetical protein IKV23_03050 [Bacteroidaceae bacterium]|nr:hypothetical protein [Bacteroidaceae bacterium]
MKKITLLLMSMFLLLGTAIAQDNTGDFYLVSVKPDSKTPVSRVDYIQLEFSKNVAIALPQENIVIKEQNSDIEYRIYDAMALDAYAIFYIEKVSADNAAAKKDGKEEDEVVKYISEVGTYSYTIPAGVITSTDGEEYAGDTFTFTIGTPLEIVEYTPNENGTDKIENIQITFNKPIIKVEMPNSGLMIVDLYWTPFSAISNEVTLSNDNKTVTLYLEEPITLIGTYYLDIYNNIFTSEDGTKNEYTSIMFKVSDNRPSFATNLQDGDRVKEIGDLEITFNNVKEVKLIDGAPDVVVYLPGGGESTGSAKLANNKITVTFDQKFTEEGDYTFVIPDGMFTMDGTANEERQINVVLYTFTITPLEIVAVTPEAGNIGSFEKVVIQFNQDVALSMDEDWQQISREITLTCGDKKYTLTYNSSSNSSKELEYLVNATWTGYEFTSTPITAEGDYTLDLSQVVVDFAAEDYTDEWGYSNRRWHGKGERLSGTYTWTVTGETSVKDIATESGSQAIYDLTGRRVDAINKAGIYIVNGKKLIVK